MRFFKYFSQTKLLVNLLLVKKYTVTSRLTPSKYYSIKSIIYIMTCIMIYVTALLI